MRKSYSFCQLSTEYAPVGQNLSAVSILVDQPTIVEKPRWSVSLWRTNLSKWTWSCIQPPCSRWI